METKNSYKVLKDRIIIMRPQRSHRGEGVEQFRNTEVELAREKKNKGYWVMVLTFKWRSGLPHALKCRKGRQF